MSKKRGTTLSFCGVVFYTFRGRRFWGSGRPLPSISSSGYRGSLAGPQNRMAARKRTEKPKAKRGAPLRYISPSTVCSGSSGWLNFKILDNPAKLTILHNLRRVSRKDENYEKTTAKNPVRNLCPLHAVWDVDALRGAGEPEDTHRAHRIH